MENGKITELLEPRMAVHLNVMVMPIAVDEIITTPPLWEDAIEMEADFRAALAKLNSPATIDHEGMGGKEKAVFDALASAFERVRTTLQVSIELAQCFDVKQTREMQKAAAEMRQSPSEGVH